jgi:holo-ACP synthase/triphosphoribosyl-dephospho-CoA synthase
MITEECLRQSLADSVSGAAVRAILTEAAVSPKPGLVDRINSGSHTDMEFFTLIDSALALLPWFRDCAIAGFDSASEEVETGPAALFEALRPRGIKAEAEMRKASGGVNTHRGYIFSLGILSAAFGRLCGLTEKPDLDGLITITKAMTADVARDFSRPREKMGFPMGRPFTPKPAFRVYGERRPAGSRP